MLENLLQNKNIRQFVKFAFVGFLSFIVDWGVYFVLTRYALLFYLAAKALSFVAAATNSYIFNRRWTFRSSDKKIVQEFTKFFIISLIGLGLNTLIMYLAVHYLKINDLVAVAVATGIVLFWNFFANKFWTFKVSDVQES